MSFSALLLALSGPIAKQVLRSLGIGVVAFVGLELAVSGLLDQARTAWGGMPATVAQYVALTGINHGLSIIAGAMIGRVSMIAFKRFELI